MIIPFNKPLVIGTENGFMAQVLESGHFSAKGPFTERCHQILQANLEYKHPLLTTSCTSALELAALLLGIQPGDEVIIPSYAFVTSANAFASKGAKIVFADSQKDHPNIDEELIEGLITPKTKAIVALHYAGAPCNMKAIMAIAKKHDVKVIEDNAQGIGSTYQSKPLGGIGHLGAISFHDTKNVHCGEGGAILVNDETLVERASVVWDMGTNKAAFRSGKVSSYGWVDIGSSFYPSELNAAFLYGQLTQLEAVTEYRMVLWKQYYDGLAELSSHGHFDLPQLADGTSHNAHTFYLITKSEVERQELIMALSSKGISSVFHFQSLHKSSYFKEKHDGRELINANKFSNCLVRLPLYHALTTKEQQYIVDQVRNFFYK